MLVPACMVVSIREDNRDEARGKCLRERNVHFVLVFQINKCTKTQFERLEHAWAHFRVEELLCVEALLELYQVYVKLVRDGAEVDDLRRRHKFVLGLD